VTNGQVTYTGYDPILLSLVTNDTYTASLAAIAIEVKTTITMTQGKYFVWIFNNTEQIVELIVE
jgi:hypothetical protein